MADWHGVSRRSVNTTDGDFEEEDAWSFEEDSRPQMRKQYFKEVSSSSAAAWRFSTSAPRMIRRTNEANKAVQQSSAPVSIPDWSKIYGKKIANFDDDDDHDISNNGHVVYNGHHGDHVHVDVEGDDDDGMVPPHEWLAKKLARSQITSFSVCEGIGRTLKGRDLSKVRNAILTKTGFLE